MMTVLLVTMGTLATAVLFWQWARMYATLRGDRVITCPENGKPAGVHLQAFLGAVRALFGREPMKVGGCSQWPEKAGCGQACLREIHAAPDGCLVRARLAKWYEGKHCVRCKADVSPAHWHFNPPALRAPDGKTRAWSEVKAEEIPEVLATHEPVCFDCHVMCTFARKYPGRAFVR